METSDKYKSNHNKAKLKTYRTNWQNQHKQNGICLDCNEKAVQGKRRCQKHLDYQVEHRKRG